MRFDLGVTKDGFHLHWWDPVHLDELAVLGSTPGIPVEWLFALTGAGWRRRKMIREMIDAADPVRGAENAATIEPGDGWKMIAAVCPEYSGAPPLWSQLELQALNLTNAEIGRRLGISESKALRWRSQTVFDPLTGARLFGTRGY